MSQPDRRSAASRLASRLPFFYGWVVVAVAFVTMGIGVNARTAFSLLFPPILDEFAWTRGVTAAAFSIGFITSMAYTPFIGMLMDRLGPRTLIPLAVIIVSAGFALATLSTEPWHLYLTLGVLVVGGSIFLAYIGHAAFLPNWFVKRRGLAVGIAFSGVGVGSMVLFPWLQRFIDAFGWREACWLMAGLLLVVVVPLNALLQRQRPEDLGLTPDGGIEVTGPDRGRTPDEQIVDHAWASIDWTLARAVATARYWWLFWGYFSVLFAWYAIQVHQTKYLVDIGYGAEQAAYALGLVPLLGIPGQIAIGHLSDRLGREWGWTLSCLGFAACYGLLLVMRGHPSPILLYLMLAGQGLLGYGIAPLYASMPLELFQGRGYGAIFGTLSVGAGLGAAAGPWATGLLYDLLGSYTAAFWIALVASLLSAGCIWLASPAKVRAVAGRVSRRRA